MRPKGRHRVKVRGKVHEIFSQAFNFVDFPEMEMRTFCCPENFEVVIRRVVCVLSSHKIFDDSRFHAHFALAIVMAAGN